MDATSEAEIEVLFWIILLSLGSVVTAIVVLVRSGRTVPLPTIRLLPRRETDESSGPGASSRPGSYS